MKRERGIDYVEFASRDPAASRRFFEQAFAWQFQDYGPDYTAFDDGGLQGGFFRGNPATAEAGAPLVVLVDGGSAEQQAAWLPRIAAGEAIVSLAVDEGAKHAPSRIATVAERSGNGFRLNGAKGFVLDGHVADRLIVAARTSGADA